MKVLMLSTDKNIFEEGSPSQERMRDYGGLVEELHIVVYTAKSEKIKTKNIGRNVFLYPTRTSLGLFCFYLINVYRLGGRIIKKENGWLVTAQDPFETGLAGWLLKKRFKLPLQIQIHTDFLSPYFSKESTRNKFRVVWGRYLIKKADDIRVVSERIKNSLCSILYTSCSQITVLPIFVDTEKIKSTPVKTNLRQKYPGRFIILMASRLTKEKNIGLAIQAVANLVSSHPNILLLIVGSGPEREALNLQLTTYDLQNYVVIEDWSDDLSSYYKTADLFLLTSNYEGYGRTVVEATAAGLPVLMTDVGVAVGSVVPVGDKKELARKLSLLIEDSSERVRVLRNQEGVLDVCRSKEDYLNRIRQSWSRCLASRIHDSDMTSESGQNT